MPNKTKKSKRPVVIHERRQSGGILLVQLNLLLAVAYDRSERAVIVLNSQRPAYKLRGIATILRKLPGVGDRIKLISAQ